MNLEKIKKGNTWTWELKFWQDSAKTIPLDVSGHTFNFTAVNAAGATILTLNNAAFAIQGTNHRKVTLSNSTTAAYVVQELKYQLDVTLPSGVVEEWMAGYVNIEA